jgi:glyoxylase-like metal-dependent hydrolase (beta-lactamase superfamily II)
VHRSSSALAALFAVGVLCSVPAQAWAENYECPGVGQAQTVHADDGACVQRIAEGVYVIIHRDATDQWPHSNTGVIEGRNSLFVIDSTYLPSRARADIELMRQITGKPVSHLTTTHWHMDHNFGASAYTDAFPNLTYLVERNTARHMEINQIWYARMSTTEGSPRMQAVTNLEAQLARGVNADGAPLSAQELGLLRTVRLPRRQNELQELATLRFVPPTRLFDGSMRLNFEGRRIEIRNWGRANSPNDTTFYLPREQVLFAGDIIVQSPMPYTGSSHPRDWGQVLRQIEAIPVRALVPGHGPTLPDHTYTAQVRNLMETVSNRVEVLLRAGRTEDQMKAEIQVEDLRAAVAVWNPPIGEEADWQSIITSLVDRAWQNVRGQED